jgi:hypothetical protein
MSRRPFDRDELDQRSGDAERSVVDLQRYAMTTDADPPHGLADRIMAAVEHEPAPRRGFLSLLFSPPAGRGPARFVRAGALAATLVLAVAGALFAGQLAGLLRDVGGNATPTPLVLPSSTEPPSVTPAPSPSIEPSPSATPAPSGDGGSGSTPGGVSTPHETPKGTPEDTVEGSQTPRPSPTVTASPTATPQQSS